MINKISINGLLLPSALFFALPTFAQSNIENCSGGMEVKFDLSKVNNDSVNYANTYLTVVGKKQGVDTSAFVKFSAPTKEGELVELSKQSNGKNYALLLNKFVSTSNNVAQICVPPLISGRIYISVGNPLDLPVVKDGDGHYRVQGPDVNNPSTTTNGTVFDKVEFTYTTGGQTVINPTGVDFISIPYTITQEKDVYGRDGSIDSIIDNMKFLVCEAHGYTIESPNCDAAWNKSEWSTLAHYEDINGKVVSENTENAHLVRVDAPGRFGSTFNKYFNPYIEKLIKYYSVESGKSIKMDLSEINKGIWVGQFQDKQLKFYQNGDKATSPIIFNFDGDFSNSIFLADQGPFTKDTPEKATISRNLSSAIVAGLLMRKDGNSGIDTLFDKQGNTYLANKVQLEKLIPFYFNNGDNTLDYNPNICGQSGGEPCVNIYQQAVHGLVKDNYYIKPDKVYLHSYAFAYDDFLGMDGTNTKTDSYPATITLGNLQHRVFPHTDSDVPTIPDASTTPDKPVNGETNPIKVAQDGSELTISIKANYWANLHYTINGSNQQNVPMVKDNSGSVSYAVKNLTPGTEIEYWVTYLMDSGKGAKNSQHSTYIVKKTSSGNTGSSEEQNSGGGTEKDEPQQDSGNTNNSSSSLCGYLSKNKYGSCFETQSLLSSKAAFEANFYKRDGTHGNNEQQWYKPDHVIWNENNKSVTLKAEVKSTNGKPYTSGEIRTKGRFTITKDTKGHDISRGGVEVKAKVPYGKGRWPAIWMMPQGDMPWPSGMEVDILEFMQPPYAVTGTVHYGLKQQDGVVTWNYNNNIDIAADNAPAKEIDNGWHKYGFEWNVTSSGTIYLTWYFDGHPFHQLEMGKSAAGKYYSVMRNPSVKNTETNLTCSKWTNRCPDKYQSLSETAYRSFLAAYESGYYLRINMAVGGDGVEPKPDTNKFPVTEMQIASISRYVIQDSQQENNDTGDSNTDGSNTGGGNTDGSNTGGGNTDGSNAGGSNTDGSNAGGGNTNSGNTEDIDHTQAIVSLNSDGFENLLLQPELCDEASDPCPSGAYFIKSGNGQELYKLGTTMGGSQLWGDMGKTGQWSHNRYAILIGEGNYEMPDPFRLNYYMEVTGVSEFDALNKDQKVKVMPGINALNSSGNTAPGALNNFWRSLANLNVDSTALLTPINPDKPNDRNPAGVLRFGVSQASGIRNVYFSGKDLLMCDWNTINWACGQASGGFIANSYIDGEMNLGSQQQFYIGNTYAKMFKGSVWNYVLHNAKSGDGITKHPYPFTDVNDGHKVLTKPRLIVNSNQLWEIDDGNPSHNNIDINDFVVLSAGNSSDVLTADVDKIQDALNSGKKGLLILPGVYDFTKRLHVKENQIVLGIGMPSLICDAIEGCLLTDDQSIRVAGITLEPGIIADKSAKNSLLTVGDYKQDHPSIQDKRDAVILQDVYCRVARTRDVSKLSENHSPSAYSCITVNANDVIGENLWLWRADHDAQSGHDKYSYNNQVDWDTDEAQYGLIVNGDDVVMNGLAVEHFKNYQTIWNGKNGVINFYQSEMPYTLPEDDSANTPKVDCVASDGQVEQEIKSYAVCPSLYVAKTATGFVGNGIGVYSYLPKEYNHGRMQQTIVAETAIYIAANPEDVSIKNSVNRWLNGGKNSGISYNILDAAGNKYGRRIYGPDSAKTDDVANSVVAQYP
ncbi:beta-1,3-glucanase family protein [Vibrio marisflavi]|uniref:GH16 domain-containing protein n=1 Tax=Vibrio marisflavi CECT 7928 TaxID=634439 RepID=A0ABM9AAE0_9VIBR|nr:beta-1,3-glucanase family protein [Vibrio marisflavi]CAH0543236.1 hypothetical protein VMF7928_04485 [Vibrio marisflavi CECT 7928]